MPLTPGQGPKILSQNIEEVLHSFKQSRKIGMSKPKSMDKARKQAIAISYSKQKNG